MKRSSPEILAAVRPGPDPRGDAGLEAGGRRAAARRLGDDALSRRLRHPAHLRPDARGRGVRDGLRPGGGPARGAAQELPPRRRHDGRGLRARVLPGRPGPARLAARGDQPRRYPQLSPKLRAVLEAYVAGVRRFMAEHPEQVPAWAQEIHPWDSVALSRYIIWGWPLGEAVHELGAAGIRLTPPAYRGSNEMLIAPGRTAMKAPIAVVDPHLSWYGTFRFYEARLYARDEAFSVSGVAILGQPIPSLGHSRYCSVAMTTGGPDTSDVYEEEVNPDDPRSYRFDGQWRKMTVRTYQIGVKEGAEVKQRTVDVEYTHHGPVVARKAGKAYTIAIPYMEQVELGDQVYEMMKAHNLDEMKKALVAAPVDGAERHGGDGPGGHLLPAKRPRPDPPPGVDPAVQSQATPRRTSGGASTRSPTSCRSPTRPAAGCRTATAPPPP